MSEQSSKSSLFDRFRRAGVTMNAATVDDVALVLSFAKSRESLLEAVDNVVALLASRGLTADKNLVLEATAAMRGMRSWDALSALLPASKASRKALLQPPELSYPDTGVFRCPEGAKISPRGLAEAVATIAERPYPHGDFVWDKFGDGSRWQCGVGNDFFLHALEGEGVWRVTARYWEPRYVDALRDVLVRHFDLRKHQIFNGVPATEEAAKKRDFDAKNHVEAAECRP